MVLPLLSKSSISFLSNPTIDLLLKYLLLQFPYFGYAKFVSRRHI